MYKRLYHTILLACTCAVLAAAVPGCGDDDTGTTTGPPPPPVSGTWTWMNPLPQGNALHSIDGISEFDMWAVGEKGVVTRYRGIDWNVHSRPTFVDLNGVFNPAAGEVFVVGGGGTILHLDGDTFEPMASATGDDLHAIWGASSLKMIAVGDRSTIVRYDGADWQAEYTGTGTLRSVWGIDKPDEAFAVGDGGEVVHWDGAQWTSQTPFTSADLHGVWADKPRDWFAVGAGGEVWHNTGSGWFAMGSPTGDDLFAVFGSDSAYVLACGASDSAYFYDDIAWTTCPLPPDRCLDSPVAALYGGWGDLCALPVPSARPTLIHCSSQMMVGEGGVVVVFDLLGHFAPLTGAQTWRDLSAIDGSSDDNVYAVGDGAAVLRYNGAEWTKPPFPVTDDLYDVWVAGPTSIYVAGDNGRILHSTDGDNWTIQTSGTTAPLRGIHGDTDQAIHCVGAAGTVLLRTGGTWQAQSVPSGTYNDVWMESATAGWLVGDAGLLVRVLGTSYVAVTAPVAADLNAVWGNAPDRVFAVGDGGVALLYDGTDWRATPTPNSGDLLAVAGDGTGAAWAIGTTGGALLYWTGSVWRVDDGPAAAEMRGLWRGSNHLFVAGHAGAILEYRN